MSGMTAFILLRLMDWDSGCLNNVHSIYYEINMSFYFVFSEALLNHVVILVLIRRNVCNVF